MQCSHESTAGHGSSFNGFSHVPQESFGGGPVMLSTKTFNDLPKAPQPLCLPGGDSTSYPSLSVLALFPCSVLLLILHPCKVAGLPFRLGLGCRNNLSGSKSNFSRILIF